MPPRAPTLLAVVLLAACGRTPDELSTPTDATSQGATPPPVLVRSHFPRAGLSILHPDTILVRRAPDRAGSGSADAGDPASAPLAVLRLPDSDDLLWAELHLAADSDDAAVAQCTEPPSDMHAQTRIREELDGVPFVRFDHGRTDAQGSRFVRAYRTVRDRTCHAIDLVIGGAPDGQARSALTREIAIERLHGVLAGLRFDVPAHPAVAPAR